MSALFARLQTALLLLTAACGPGSTEPLDGGRAVSFSLHPESVRDLSDDPCWRQENGGWHHSIGHCEAMTRPEKMSGVWVTAFEENDFFRDTSIMPSSKDRRRNSTYIEVDQTKVHRLARVKPSSGDGDAYLLSFIGRRTRDPFLVDCQGTPSFVFVVDHLLSARHLGFMDSLSRQEYRDDFKSRPVTVTRQHRGRWGHLEKEAIKRCT